MLMGCWAALLLVMRVVVLLWVGYWAALLVLLVMVVVLLWVAMGAAVLQVGCCAVLSVAGWVSAPMMVGCWAA